MINPKNNPDLQGYTDLGKGKNGWKKLDEIFGCPPVIIVHSMIVAERRLHMTQEQANQEASVFKNLLDNCYNLEDPLKDGHIFVANADLIKVGKNPKIV